MVKMVHIVTHILPEKKKFKCQITQHQAEKKSYGNQTKEPQT